MLNFFKRLKNKENYEFPRSQRYYYPQKELLGDEHKTDIISFESISEICEEFARLQSLWYKLSGVERDEIENKSHKGFEFVKIKIEDIEYSDRGNNVDYCYLPTVVEMYDEGSPLTYFISIIKGRCEIRSTRFAITSLEGKKLTNHVTWYESIGQYEKVEDPSTIQKIELTIIEYKSQLRDMYKDCLKRIKERELRKKELILKNENLVKGVTKDLEEMLFLIGVSKNSYKVICSEATKSSNFLEAVIEILSRKNYIVYLDWKMEPQDVLWNINNLLKKQRLSQIELELDRSRLGLDSYEILEYIQKNLDGMRLFGIDSGTDGYFIGIISNKKYTLFLLIFQKLLDYLKEKTIKIIIFK